MSENASTLSLDDIVALEQPTPVTMFVNTTQRIDGQPTQFWENPSVLNRITAIACPFSGQRANIFAIYIDPNTNDAFLYRIFYVKDGTPRLTTTKLGGEQSDQFCTINKDRITFQKLTNDQPPMTVTAHTPHGDLRAALNGDGIRIDLIKPGDAHNIPMAVTEYVLNNCEDGNPGIVTHVYPDGAQLSSDLCIDNEIRIIHRNYQREYTEKEKTFLYLLDVLNKAGHNNFAVITKIDGTEDYRALVEYNCSAWAAILSSKESGNTPVVSATMLEAYKDEQLTIVPYFTPDNRLVNITIQTQNVDDRGYHGILFMIDTPPNVYFYLDGKSGKIKEVLK